MKLQILPALHNIKIIRQTSFLTDNIHNREMYISVEFILFNPLRILAIDMIIVNLVFQII